MRVINTQTEAVRTHTHYRDVIHNLERQTSHERGDQNSPTAVNLVEGTELLEKADAAGLNLAAMWMEDLRLTRLPTVLILGRRGGFRNYIPPDAGLRGQRLCE